MPRHSSLQVFSDLNTKVVQGYSENKSNDSSNKPKRVQTEKVVNVMGSCAGAGSQEFHLYLAARKRETDRLEAIEREEVQKQQESELAEKNRRNKEEAELKTRKNAEKRKRKKDKAVQHKNKHVKHNNDSDDQDDVDATKSNNNTDRSNDSEQKQSSTSIFSAPNSEAVAVNSKLPTNQTVEKDT